MYENSCGKAFCVRRGGRTSEKLALGGMASLPEPVRPRGGRPPSWVLLRANTWLPQGARPSDETRESGPRSAWGRGGWGASSEPYYLGGSQASWEASLVLEQPRRPQMDILTPRSE